MLVHVFSLISCWLSFAFCRFFRLCWTCTPSQNIYSLKFVLLSIKYAQILLLTYHLLIADCCTILSSCQFYCVALGCGNMLSAFQLYSICSFGSWQVVVIYNIEVQIEIWWFFLSSSACYIFLIYTRGLTFSVMEQILNHLNSY